MHPSSTWFVIGARVLVTLGYQAMRSLLVMRMGEAAGMTYEEASSLAQLTWAASILGQPAGGALADRVLGAKATAGIGAGVIAFGLGLMMVPELTMLYAALAVIAVGEMMFRPNSYVLLGSGYASHEHTRVAGFAAEFALMNVAFLVSGVLGGVFMSSFGFAVGLVPAILAVAGGAALIFFAPVTTPAAPPEAQPESPSRIPLLLAAAGAVGLFLLVNAAVSGALYARLSPGYGGGFAFNLNPILGLIGGVAVAVYWSSGMRLEYGASLGMWFAIALGLLGFAGLAAAFLPNEDGGGVGFFLVTILLSVAELFMFPIAYAAATAAAPHKWRSTLFGAFSAVTILSAAPRLLSKLFEGVGDPASVAGFQAAGGALLALGGAAAAFAMRGWLHELAISAFSADPQPGARAQTAEAPPDTGGSSNDLMVGGITLLVGVGITAASIAAAGGGGRYVVTTGLIIYGLFRLGRGLTRLGK